MFHHFDFTLNSVHAPEVNCRVAHGFKYRPVMESVETVITGDHEREVIGICGFALIAVIICRPWFSCWVFSCNYETKKKNHREEKGLVSWRGWAGRYGCQVQIRRQDVGSWQIKRWVSLVWKKQLLPEKQWEEQNEIRRKAVFYSLLMKQCCHI